MTLAEVTAAVDMLRTRGVKSYLDVAGGGFSVEFFPPVVDVKAEPARPDESKCACGHASHEHNAGLCLLGCEPLKCSPEPQK